MNLIWESLLNQNKESIVLCWCLLKLVCLQLLSLYIITHIINDDDQHTHTALYTVDNRNRSIDGFCSRTGRKLLTLFPLQEVVKLPLEFVRQLSIKVQHQRPGKTKTHDIIQFDICSPADETIENPSNVWMWTRSYRQQLVEFNIENRNRGTSSLVLPAGNKIRLQIKLNNLHAYLIWSLR